MLLIRDSLELSRRIVGIRMPQNEHQCGEVIPQDRNRLERPGGALSALARRCSSARNGFATSVAGPVSAGPVALVMPPHVQCSERLLLRKTANQGVFDSRGHRVGK